MAKTQTKGGDLLRNHNYKELKKIPENQMYHDDFPNESDTEIWFLMAIGEYVTTTGDMKFLTEKVEYLNENATGDIWEHAKATFHFIKYKIGTGEQGLIRMLHGDWNDYLSKIGQFGNGQSVMNSGMMCKTLIDCIKMANKLGDPVATEMQDYLEKLQSAVGKTFDKGWFIRAYDDHNQPVGGYDDRLFLNAQSWAVLGKCGTPDQRRLALENAIKYNSTPIGLTLMSKAYSSPTPENISWAPIPAGEGENAGIWPQTVGWIIWALADEGMSELAMQEWEKSTLHQHTSLYPEIPFGIINGPDCYSSFHAKEREGWTQQAVFDRMNQLPMLPIIAWQPYGLIKILKKK
jgi:cellobiose phosphorylase